MIQHLEDALSRSITLKKHVRKPGNVSREKADEFLEQHRSDTLGRAIKIVKAENLLPEILHQRLTEFLSERNWLVHKCMPRNRDDMNSPESQSMLFKRIKSISVKAQMLFHSVEDDMMLFSEARGVDMSGVRAAVQNHYKA